MGVNGAGLEATNPEMVDGRVLPWLQDTAQADVWGHWAVAYRDVDVLDADGAVRGVYNLTAHDLALPQSYATLKQLLLDAR